MTASDMDKVCKAGLHPRNRFNTRYDFPQLIPCSPALGAFVKPNAHGDDSIDYTDPQAHQCFRGIIGRGERFDLTMCNPPFHASVAEAAAGTQRKLPISA